MVCENLEPCPEKRRGRRTQESERYGLPILGIIRFFFSPGMKGGESVL